MPLRGAQASSGEAWKRTGPTQSVGLGWAAASHQLPGETKGLEEGGEGSWKGWVFSGLGTGKEGEHKPRFHFFELQALSSEEGTGESDAVSGVCIPEATTPEKST